MVLVDSSVWISLYRKRTTEVGERLWQLTVRNEAAVCGQIWVEFIGGFRRERERREYEDSLAAFPFLPTGRSEYGAAARLLARHPRLGPGEAIIAATAIGHGAALYTLDRDFTTLSADGLELF